MASKKPAPPAKFTTETPKAIYKGSLLQDLLPFKKNLFEKFQAKGLAFKGPDFKVAGDGSTMYEFTAGEKADKVVFKGLGKGKYDVTARRRKKDGDFDISAATKISEQLTVMGKIEQRAADRDVAVGATFKGADGKIDIKMHPLNLISREKQTDVKASGIYKLPMHKPLSFAVDLTLGAGAGFKLQKYTAGMAYDIKCQGATAGLTYAHDQTVTMDFLKKFPDQKVDVGAEVVYDPKASFDSKMVWMLGAAYTHDKEHVFKAKVNSNFQMALYGKKTLSSQFTVFAGSLMSLSNMNQPQELFQNLGFKLQIKP